MLPLDNLAVCFIEFNLKPQYQQKLKHRNSRKRTGSTLLSWADWATNKCFCILPRIPHLVAGQKWSREKRMSPRNVGSSFPLRKISWKVRWGTEGWRMSDGGKVGCSVPHWDPAAAVAATMCQIYKAYGWRHLAVQEYTRWHLQMSEHVLQVWKDSRGLCHSLTRGIWKFSWLIPGELK